MNARMLLAEAAILALLLAPGCGRKSEPAAPRPALEPAGETKSSSGEQRREHPGTLRVISSQRITTINNTAQNVTNTVVNETVQVNQSATAVRIQASAAANSGQGGEISSESSSAVLVAPELRRANPTSGTMKLFARSGSKLRIEGTSNIHDWQVESPLIGGSLEVGPEFPLDPTQRTSPGPIWVQGEAFITGRSLKSIEKDGRPYSDRMDEIMYEKLSVQKVPKIVFRISSLALKSARADRAQPYELSAGGTLTVGDVSREISFDLNALVSPDGKCKFSGTLPLKMTDFKIQPPAPKLAFGLIKTGDDIRVVFEWVVGKRASIASTSR